MNKIKPFFSIVIPTLNEEKFLPKLLQDLTSQSYHDFEVIICDGNSKDATQEKAKLFSKKLSIALVESKKRNLCYQRNVGANRSSGKYLIFIDADSRIPTNFLIDLFNTLSKRKYLIAMPYMNLETDDASLQYLVRLLNAGIEASQLLPRPFVTGGLFVIERHFFKHLGEFTIKKNTNKNVLFAEDVDLLIRAKRIGVIAKKLPRPYYTFSLRRFRKEGSLSVIFRYFLSAIDFTNGGLTSKVRYEMGGHVYTH